MIKIFYLILISLFCFPLANAFPYLQLDNQTVASFDEVLEDPFLVIRTKAEGPHAPMNWIKSCQTWAHLETLFDFPEKPADPCYFAPFTTQITSDLEVSGSACYDYLKPVFTIHYQGNEPCYLWWQIATDAEFQHVFYSLNQQIPFTERIEITDIQETFLNPHQTYYFRACANNANWTPPFSFQVNKPFPIQDVHFSKTDQGNYLFSWDSPSDEAITYLIFASNALDFIPSIYLNEQFNLLYDFEVLDKEITNNLIAETQQSFFEVDGRYAYYRIVTCHHHQISVPSSLIYLYDQDLHQIRTALKQDDLDPLKFKRQPIEEDEYLFSNHWWNSFLDSIHQPHAFVSNEIWNELKPYFLPSNHPIKVRLDRLFKKHRATLSAESFEKAGFGKPKQRKPTQIVVGHHAQFKGYIFKVFLDTQPPLCEWENWKKRIDGANAIRACIKRHGFHHFSVPHKWIYPLPEEPSPPQSSRYHRKNFILIAEDMHILKAKDNLKAFKKRITPHLLKDLYTILTEEGLIDSVYPDNIPFTEKGKISFIDTEHHHLSPIPYHKLAHFLSVDMKNVWLSITK